MKIIIIGAGQVGGTLAENLVGERNEITLIDIDQERLRELQDKMDLKVVVGQGCHPDVLENSGAEDADMIIAVTNDDATNMIACQIAYSLFSTPRKIARIRSNQILKFKDKLFQNNDIPVDHIIAPEQLVTRDIARLIDYPGALQVLEFAKGKVSLVAVKAYYGGLLVGHALSTLKEHIPNVDTRVAAIYRNGKPIRPLGTTVIEADDEVFFIAASIHIRAVMNELQKLEKAYKRILIAGGGNIGAGLASLLETNHQVKLIERSPERAAKLASDLNNTLVFIGDSSDQELLMEEHIDQFDVFIAVTNDDEANIMSSL
jgi:trk system potassium uptake protein TrkA